MPPPEGPCAHAANLLPCRAVERAFAPGPVFMNPLAPTPTLKDWLPAFSLAFAAFIFVTTELLPVGLLPDIARSLARSESSTGLLLTVYAWMVAVASLPLTALTARFDRRFLVLTLLVLFAAGNVLAALSHTFAMLLAARICVALCHAVFWSIATPLVTRIAPPGNRAKALGAMVTGTSLATVLGVPLGTLLGHHLGWRITFAAVGVTALGIALLMRMLVSPQPSRNAGSFKSLPVLAHRPALLKIYLLTLLTVTGHFAAFTYLSPFMIQVGGLSSKGVAFLLLLLGGAGIAGSYLGGKIAERWERWFLAGPLIALSACLGLLVLAGTGIAAAAVLCFAWGMAWTAVTLGYQTRVLICAPDEADIAVSLYSGIFNIGIGGGALIGSRVFSHGGVEYIGYAGMAFVLLAALIALLPPGSRPCADAPLQEGGGPG